MICRLRRIDRIAGRRALAYAVPIGALFVVVLVAFSSPVLYDDVTELDEGVVLADDMADAQFPYGTIHGNPEPVTAGDRRGLSLDGRDDYVELNEGKMVEGDALTVSIRLKTSTENAVVLSDNRGYVLYIRGSSGGAVRYIVQTDRGREFVQVPDAATAEGVWQHHALVYDGSTLRAYVDGELVATAEQQGSIVYDDRTATIGRRDTAGDLYYQGGIADLRVYDRALTSFEVARLSDGTIAPVPAPPGDRWVSSFLVIATIVAAVVLHENVSRWIDGR